MNRLEVDSMRTCKEWMGARRTHGERPRTESSQVLQSIIKKEMRNAPNTVVLNRSYTIMNTNLRLMFERAALSGASYSRLKIFLRGEYENRWESLRKED